MLARRTKPRRVAFSGTVGETFARETITPTISGSTSPATYAGIRIRCAQVKGGSLVLEKIGGVFNQTGNVVVQIYDRYKSNGRSRDHHCCSCRPARSSHYEHHSASLGFGC